MIQINPDRIITIELTPKEQKAILKHCRSIDRDLYNKVATAKEGVLHLLIEDCHQLRECVSAEAERAKKPKVQDILSNLYNKLATNPITRSLAEAIGEQDFASVDEANEKLQGIMSARNTTPDPEMGGLSPEQVSRLIYLSWDDNNFPLKFNKELTLSELKNSSLFTNATILLKTLIEMEKEPTATAAGNLNRKIVKILFDKVIIDEDHKKFIIEYNKVINEIDIFDVHTARVVCQSAGLIHKRKNKFLVVKKYHNLLSEERAGELYALLFESYFRKFNIGYVDRLPSLDSIQHTIAYSLYRLGKVAGSYIGVDELSEKILLPAVLKEIREALSDYIFIGWIVGARIINPLKDFGIIECKYKRSKGYSEIDKVRKTMLFDRFMECRW